MSECCNSKGVPDGIERRYLDKVSPGRIVKFDPGRFNFPGVAHFFVDDGTIPVAERSLRGTFDDRLGITRTKREANGSQSLDVQTRIRSSWGR